MTPPAGRTDGSDGPEASGASNIGPVETSDTTSWGDLTSRVLTTPGGIVALIWAGFQITFLINPYVDQLVQRAAHVGFASAVGILLTSAAAAKLWRRGIDLVLAALALVPPLILWIEQDRLASRLQEIDPIFWQDYLTAALVFALVFEVSRRILGWGLTLLAAGLITYQFVGVMLPGALGHSTGNLSTFVETHVMTIGGIYGIPVKVSLEMVFYFVLFAAVFEAIGGGSMIIRLALALTGRTVGGPAKAAVLSSGMMGSVSGSAVANVMSTGIFTIPLMRRLGFRPIFAAAVEATASTGGQIMPPVMGAAAFIMADFLQMAYSEIVLAALIPAVLYFVATALAVDFEARRAGSGTVSAGEVPQTLRILAHEGYLLIPLVWLIVRIVMNVTVSTVALEATLIAVALGFAVPLARAGGTARLALCIPLGWLAWRLAATGLGEANLTTSGLTIATELAGLTALVWLVFELAGRGRIGTLPAVFVNALAVSAQRSIHVAIPCALASIIISVIIDTSLGTKLTGLLTGGAGDAVWLLLLFAMIATLVLGAGMPTSSAYIMGAILVAPALVEVGIAPLVAHFFVLYYAIMSMVTPPVALSAYAAASIAGTRANATGIQAFMLALPGFVIPFAIILHPGLVMIGGWRDTIAGVVQVMPALAAIAATVVGWALRPLTGWMRAVLAGCGVGLVVNQLWVSIAAAALMGCLAIFALIPHLSTRGAPAQRED